MIISQCFILIHLKFIYCITGWIISYEAQNSGITQNLAPIVTIAFPDNNSSIQSGSYISYTIEVTDKEDGESRYGEILPGKVIMNIRHFQNMPAEDRVSPLFIEKGLLLFSDRQCFTCHQWDHALVGPPMIEIMKKYDSSDIEQLKTSILKGSSENWGGAIMPAQLEVSNEEAGVIVEWLLAHTSFEYEVINSGLSGTFQTDRSKTTGFYLLTASYTDHGIDNAPNTRLTGQDQVVITINN